MKLKDIPNTQMLISPSILAADFANLEADVKKILDGGADMVHLDVMDGHFVPNISFGIPVISSLRKQTEMYFDAHLMISDPLTYAEVFAKAGAEMITFHVEADSDPVATIKKIKELGCEVGMSLKPNTPASAIAPYLEELDMVLVMSVEPGFGGQSFMEDMMQKVTEVRAMITATGKNIHLQIDGGIAKDTIRQAKDAGCNCFVAGSAIFKYAEGVTAGIDVLRQA